MSTQIHDEPAYNDWTCTKSTHGDEEQGGVLSVKVVVHGHEDGEAGDCKSYTEGDEGKAEA